jgi:RNA polymerase sigma-70 factor (ECF subfamily)
MSEDEDDDPEPTAEEPQAVEQDDTSALVERAQHGDTAALNELFARYHQLVVEMARRRLGARLRAKEDPEDLAQTTFREATRDFPSYEYRGEGSLVRWLMHILQNKIRDKAEFYSAGKRDLGRERGLEVPLGGQHEGPVTFEPASVDLSVTRQVQRGEHYDLLRQALGELSPDHRTAITLVFFQGLSLREAGEKMGGRTEDAVRMMLRRAESKLGELLRPSLGGEQPLG